MGKKEQKEEKNRKIKKEEGNNDNKLHLYELNEVKHSFLKDEKRKENEILNRSERK